MAPTTRAAVRALAAVTVRKPEVLCTVSWHLAGQAFLPDDVVEVLDCDDDPSVVRAVRVGAQRRELMGARAE